MNILGLDPAARCGWAHSCGQHGVWLLTDKSDKHPGRRLERFRRLLFRAKREMGIDALAFEDASFGSNNDHTAAMHNEVRGVAKLCAAEWEIPVLTFTPSHLKKWLTGHGAAKKEHMIEAVLSRFGICVDDDNVADAITVMERARAELLTGVGK